MLSLLYLASFWLFEFASKSLSGEFPKINHFLASAQKGVGGDFGVGEADTNTTYPRKQTSPNHLESNKGW